MLHFDVVTIFPEMFEAVNRHGITRRALEEGGNVRHNPRGEMLERESG